jgi:hypothetical protein
VGYISLSDLGITEFKFAIQSFKDGTPYSNGKEDMTCPPEYIEYAKTACVDISRQSTALFSHYTIKEKEMVQCIGECESSNPEPLEDVLNTLKSAPADQTVVKPLFDGVTDLKIVEVEHVRIEHQGIGLCSYLLEAALRDMDAKLLRIFVSSNSPAAIRCYIKAGIQTGYHVIYFDIDKQMEISEGHIKDADSQKQELTESLGLKFSNVTLFFIKKGLMTTIQLSENIANCETASTEWKEETAPLAGAIAGEVDEFI